jgi:phosphoserine phosphatase
VSAARPKYASVVLDVDSTLCGIEGIDWLAQRRGPDVAARIASVTERAMNGEIPLDAIYGERMNVVRPSAEDLEDLASAYADGMAPHARSVIKHLRKAGVRMQLVTGGLRQAIQPFAKSLGFGPGDIAANDVTLDGRGAYAGYDADNPLTRDGGKLTVVRALGLPRPILAVGDGNTDLAMKPGVDTFAAFVGYVRRDTVVAGADLIISTFRELETVVLGD